jgi:hypothetical protein
MSLFGLSISLKTDIKVVFGMNSCLCIFQIPLTNSYSDGAKHASFLTILMQEKIYALYHPKPSWASLDGATRYGACQCGSKCDAY